MVNKLVAKPAPYVIARKYLRAYKAPLHLSRTLYKSALFMQNKPNLLNAQMNVSSVITNYYENVRLHRRGENKPNQTQFHHHRLYACFNFLLGMSNGENYVL